MWHVFSRLLILAFLVSSCTGEQSTGRLDGAFPPTYDIVLPPDIEHPGLLLAAADLHDVWLAAAPSGSGATVVVSLGDKTLGEQEYRLVTTYGGVAVEASSPVGASYGLYHIAWDLGVRWYHPEEVFIPVSVSALPEYNGDVQGPSFQLRGFHEHTQHPTVWSDFYMRPDEPMYREHISNYLKWLLIHLHNSIS